MDRNSAAASGSALVAASDHPDLIRRLAGVGLGVTEVTPERVRRVLEADVPVPEQGFAHGGEVGLALRAEVPRGRVAMPTNLRRV